MNLVKKGRILLELRLDMFNKSNVLFSENERTHQTRKAEELQIRNKKKGLYKKKVTGCFLS